MFAGETVRFVRMKKILEVLRYGENDIRFRTDIDPLKDPDTVHQTVTELAMAMMTTLWGGNEQAVLAMIRALAIADLGVSVNRRQMVGFLDDASGMLEASIRDARRAFEQSGGADAARERREQPRCRGRRRGWSPGPPGFRPTGRRRRSCRSSSRASRRHRREGRCARW